MQDRPLRRSLYDGHILVLCILPCGRLYLVPSRHSSAIVAARAATTCDLVGRLSLCDFARSAVAPA